MGNDFVVIDVITQAVRLHTADIKRIADRHLGIGCDQVILIEPPIQPESDFFYRIYNPNGQEVEQCGNGARCAARFFFDSGFSMSNTLQADCLAGAMFFVLENDNTISLTMGTPVIPGPASQIEIEGKPVSGQFVSLGNPHWVMVVSELNNIPIEKWGKFLNTHANFPDGVNVEWMQIVDKHKVNLRVFERGVGETLACGSGATAAVAAGIHQHLLESPVTVMFKYGQLNISWPKADDPIVLRGSAISVFAGKFRL